MITINQIIENTDGIAEALEKRMVKPIFSEVISWDKDRREILTLLEKKRSQLKILSKSLHNGKHKEGGLEDIKIQAKNLSDEIPMMEASLRELEQKIQEYLLELPNIPDDDVPSGGKENNMVLSVYGEKPTFHFEPKDHVELATSLHLVDFERGTKIGGKGKWAYIGNGAILEWALINFFVEFHRNNGYKFVLPPHLLKVQSGFVAGQFPKFTEDVYYIRPNEGEEPTHFLLPTAETALVNYYVDEIIDERKLPLKLFSYTPCYRKEAGGYRTNERGTIRGNMFNKVEMFCFSKPDESHTLFDIMIEQCIGIMNALGLHFRVSKLAAGDCSFAMSKTYDLEVWIPSINEYKEVSSVSSANTFQAVRGNIRYKDKETGKNLFVHTLNGSGLATSRVFPAILEQFQQADGTVLVPEVLRHYVGTDILKIEDQ